MVDLFVLCVFPITSQTLLKPLKKWLLYLKHAFFQQKASNENETEEKKSEVPEEVIPIPEAEPDCFDMVSQVEWERDVVWDPEDAKEKLQARPPSVAGWVPTLSNRTAVAYYAQQGKELYSVRNVCEPCFIVKGIYSIVSLMFNPIGLYCSNLRLRVLLSLKFDSNGPIA